MKAQFLHRIVSIGVWINDEIGLSHFIVEATPPRRMVSGCSVNGSKLASAYSYFAESEEQVGKGRWGERKNLRPSGVCMLSLQ